MTDTRQSTADRLARDAKALERAVRRKTGANYRVDRHTADLHSDIATEKERDELRAEVERLREELAASKRYGETTYGVECHLRQKREEVMDERDELRDLLRQLRQWVATSQALAPQLGRSTDFNEGKALALAAVAGWLDEHVPTDEPRYATAEELQAESAVPCPNCRAVAAMVFPPGSYRGDPGCPVCHGTHEVNRPGSGAQPFDPKVHSDKRGTVIGGG